MDGLQNGSMAAFAATVVTLGHTRKFARKARHYMRTYRAGAAGLDADSAARVMRKHRCILDLPPASRSRCGTRQQALPEARDRKSPRARPRGGVRGLGIRSTHVFAART